jgi:hypothetical protein
MLTWSSRRSGGGAAAAVGADAHDASGSNTHIRQLTMAGRYHAAPQRLALALASHRRPRRIVDRSALVAGIGSATRALRIHDGARPRRSASLGERGTASLAAAVRRVLW